MDEKLYESDLLKRLVAGTVLLRPLEIKSVIPGFRTEHIDAWIEIGFPETPEQFPFIVEAKSQNTPLIVRGAIAQVRRCVANYPPTDRKPYPMIYVPYLSPERLDDLEREQISGVDMCGNGLIIVPGRIYVFRRGYDNIAQQPKALNNPYAGRSSLVARMLLMKRNWDRLKDLHEAINKEGASISKGQVSKAVTVLEEELILWRSDIISLREPALLLDRLGQAFKKPAIKKRLALRLSPHVKWSELLSSETGLQWALTGESSANYYTVLSQSGPRQVTVSNLELAAKCIGGTPEPSRNFADIELLETQDVCTYFQTKPDNTGMRWSSRIQTWLELQAGDARQQSAATTIRESILKGTAHGMA